MRTINIILIVLFVLLLVKLNNNGTLDKWATSNDQTNIALNTKGTGANGGTEPFDATKSNMDSVYNNLASDMHAKFETNTNYDELIDIFKSKNKKCPDTIYTSTCSVTENIDLMELYTMLDILSVKNIEFNRENQPVEKYVAPTDADNKLLPIAQSVIDIITERVGRTGMITDITNIEILTSENQKQFTFLLHFNYPVITVNNVPKLINLIMRVVMIRRKTMRDDVFRSYKYDTSKFITKELKIIDKQDIKDTTEPIDHMKDNIHNGEYFSYNGLLDDNVIDDKTINRLLLDTRKKHEREMDYRNIYIEENDGTPK